MWYNIAEVWSILLLPSSEGHIPSLAGRESKFIQTSANFLPD